MKEIRILIAIPMLLFALFAIHSPRVAAQNRVPRTRMVPLYDAAHEVTLQGTVKEVMAKPAAGSPLGMHMIVATSSGDVDAHLGLLSVKAASDAGLVPGATVEVVGAMAQVGGRNLLLVRKLNVGSQTIEIRNERGIPAFQMNGNRSSKAISRGGRR